MRPRDIDRSGDIWVYRPRRHKTKHRGKEREVYVPVAAQMILRPYLLRDAEAHCFSPRDSEAKRRTPRGRGKA